MTKTELSGEARHAMRRRRFWLVVAAFIGLGGVIGFFGGLTSGLSGIDLVTIPAVAVGGVIVAIVGFILISIWFYRSVDELETADNLWGSLYGFYFYAAALPAWWALEYVGVAPPIDHWAIYIATIAFAFAVYGIRKIINR